jgi:hypothetical protein
LPGEGNFTAMMNAEMSANQAYRFCVAPMMEWTDRAEKQSAIST